MPDNNDYNIDPPKMAGGPWGNGGGDGDGGSPWNRPSGGGGSTTDRHLTEEEREARAQALKTALSGPSKKTERDSEIGKRVERETPKVDTSGMNADEARAAELAELQRIEAEEASLRAAALDEGAHVEARSSAADDGAVPTLRPVASAQALARARGDLRV